MRAFVSTCVAVGLQLAARRDTDASVPPLQLFAHMLHQRKRALAVGKAKAE